MKNSQAYQSLVDQMNATGRMRAEGYDERLWDGLYDWEIEEAEQLVWNQFVNKNDAEIAVLLPKLKKFDGISALKNRLKKCNLPSDESISIAQILYEHTKEGSYLDLMMENIMKSQYKLSYVARLIYLKPEKKVYEALKNIYLKCDDPTVRDTAVTGLLYNKGIIKNPLNMQEIFMNVALKRKFVSENASERAKILEAFEVGGLTP